MDSYEIEKMRDCLEELGFKIYSISHFKPDYGKWDENGTKMVIVDSDGMVWTREFSSDENIINQIGHICPNGKGLDAPFLMRMLSGESLKLEWLP